MAEPVVVEPMRGGGARRKISVGTLPEPVGDAADAGPPPIRRTRSVGSASPGGGDPDESERDAPALSPRDAEISAQLAALDERTAALLEHSPRAAELTRLLSRADAQTKNSTIAVNKVYLMESRLKTAVERLEKICEALDAASPPSAGAEVAARYDRRNHVRTLRAVGSIEAMVMTQSAALNVVTDKLDLVMMAVTRLATIQQDVRETRDAVARIADALEAIEQVADAPAKDE